MYQGHYHGKDVHSPDMDAVLQRSWAVGVQKIIITAGTLAEARAALELSRTDERLFCTAGVHPTRCNEFEQFPQGAEEYLSTAARGVPSSLKVRREGYSRNAPTPS